MCKLMSKPQMSKENWNTTLKTYLLSIDLYRVTAIVYFVRPVHTVHTIWSTFHTLCVMGQRSSSFDKKKKKITSLPPTKDIADPAVGTARLF